MRFGAFFVAGGAALVGALVAHDASAVGTRIFELDTLDRLSGGDLKGVTVGSILPGAPDVTGAGALSVGADGLIIASPGYHGSISGLVKNALDSLEGLSAETRPYFDGRAVGCIVAASGAQAAGSTLAALRAVVHALRGWPTPLGATLHTGPDLFDAGGGFLDAKDAWQVETVAAQVVAFASAWGASSERGRG